METIHSPMGSATGLIISAKLEDMQRNQQKSHPVDRFRSEYHNCMGGKQNFNDIIKTTKDVLESVVLELFPDLDTSFNTIISKAESTSTSYSDLVTKLGPFITGLRFLSSLDHKNNFRMMPQGKIALNPYDFFTQWVNLMGLEEGTKIFTKMIGIGETIRQKFDFQTIVLVNIYVILNIFLKCWSEARRITGKNLWDFVIKRGVLLLEALEVMMRRFDVKSDFNDILDWVSECSHIVGLDLNVKIE